MFRNIYVSFIETVKNTEDTNQKSHETFKYPTEFTMPNKEYDDQLIDVSSAMYKALVDLIKTKVCRQ